MVQKISRSIFSNNIIGKRVREARRAARPTVSQDALSGRLAARGVNIGRAGIAKIESGRRAVSDYEVVALANALFVPVTWLLEGGLDRLTTHNGA